MRGALASYSQVRLHLLLGIADGHHKKQFSHRPPTIDDQVILKKKQRRGSGTQLGIRDGAEGTDSYVLDTSFDGSIRAWICSYFVFAICKTRSNRSLKPCSARRGKLLAIASVYDTAQPGCRDRRSRSQAPRHKEEMKVPKTVSSDKCSIKC
ncbi:hypothetical protein B0T21DRAFT_346459 [Apiosordaria backusii]|uniref:Uncharacterized protein n=1 Tax=Apiosordaria backusii TaxID=314023 RepID=A0AA40BRK5_9PEZI|nr:hypothetical protein B0T21DRAFT_346459 [Apiosordaria backusii]